jgi:formiminotetrahydrofolate cyclodeaminase
MAAALGHMVAAMSRGKKNYQQYDRELSAAIARLSILREELKAAIDADADSYNAVVKAYKAAKHDGASEDDVTQALKGATSVPLGVAQRAHEVEQVVESLRNITNPKMSSDLTVAIALARAAVTGALANVDINLDSLGDQAFIQDVRAQTAALRG